MIFSSPVFVFFFLPVVWIISRLLPGQKARNIWLALASLIFFAFGQLPYLILLLGSVCANYLFGLALTRETPDQNSSRRRMIAGLAVAVNLIALGIFKYLDFILKFINSITGMINIPGPSGLELPMANLILPIGISFYTFQGLSYVLDVYRDPSAGTRSFGKLLLYISFFPQLIAGPIVLYRDISAQIDNRILTPEHILTGLKRFIRGLGKKLILADTMAVIVDGIFGMDPALLDFRLAWLAAVCYTLQIYFDFSGYSDMAIGLGYLFGFRFRENFHLPYAAKSIRDFWRRWHISLSTWFRDYLYIPLGGNRRGKTRTAINKFLVFFLTGLWHGANWTFILWGLWHGLFSVLEDRNIIPRRLRESFFGHIYAMLIVILGFTLFRAESVSYAFGFFARMFALWPTGNAYQWGYNYILLRALLNARTVFILILSILFASGVFSRLAERVKNKIPALALYNAPVSAAFYSGLFVLAILNMVSSGYSPFIYFQF